MGYSVTNGITKTNYYTFFFAFFTSKSEKQRQINDKQQNIA